MLCIISYTAVCVWLFRNGIFVLFFKHLRWANRRWASIDKVAKRIEKESRNMANRILLWQGKPNTIMTGQTKYYYDRANQIQLWQGKPNTVMTGQTKYYYDRANQILLWCFFCSSYNENLDTLFTYLWLSLLHLFYACHAWGKIYENRFSL
jgi:hypothetical protein